MASKRGFKPPVKKQGLAAKPVPVKDGASKPLSNSQYEEIFDAVVHFEGIRSPVQAESMQVRAAEPCESASVDNSQSSLVDSTTNAPINPSEPVVDSESQSVSAYSAAFKVPAKQPADSESSADHSTVAKPKLNRPKTLREALKVQETNSQFSSSLSQLGSSSLLLTQDAMLTQPPKHLRHRQRLQWLQDRRGVGLYIQCDICKKWRWSDIDDPVDVPKSWTCRENPDANYNDCIIPEKPISVYVEEDLIHNEYTAGSIVWAKVFGYPWWPAMVDDCPDTEQYYWLDGYSDIPTHYHVIFFDYESSELSRSWVAGRDLVSFKHEPHLDEKHSLKPGHKCRIDSGKLQAEDALKLGVKQRLKRYSFLARWTKEIVTPPASDSELVTPAAAAKGRRKGRKQRKERPEKKTKDATSVDSSDDETDKQRVKKTKDKQKNKMAGSSADERKHKEDQSKAQKVNSNDNGSSEDAEGQVKDTCRTENGVEEEVSNGGTEMSVTEVKYVSKQDTSTGSAAESAKNGTAKGTASQKKSQVSEGSQDDQTGSVQDTEIEIEALQDVQGEDSQDEQAELSQDEQGESSQDLQPESSQDEQPELSQDEQAELSQDIQAESSQDEQAEAAKASQSEHKAKRSKSSAQNDKNTTDTHAKPKETNKDQHSGATQDKHSAKQKENTAKNNNKRKETHSSKDEKDEKPSQAKQVTKRRHKDSKSNQNKVSDTKDTGKASSSADKHTNRKEKGLNPRCNTTEAENRETGPEKPEKNEENAGRGKSKAVDATGTRAIAKLKSKAREMVKDNSKSSCNQKSMQTARKSVRRHEASDTLASNAVASNDGDASPALSTSMESVSEQSFEQITHQVAEIVGEPIGEEDSDQIQPELDNTDDETPDLLLDTAAQDDDDETQMIIVESDAEQATTDEDASMNSEPGGIFNQSSSMESFAIQDATRNPPPEEELISEQQELKQYISQTLGDNVDIFENSGQSMCAQQESDEELKRLREHITKSRINEQDHTPVLTTNIAFDKLVNAKDAQQKPRIEKKTPAKGGKRQSRVDRDSDNSDVEVPSGKRKARKLVHDDDLSREVATSKAKETRTKSTGKENKDKREMETKKIGKKLNKADFILKRRASSDSDEQRAKKVAKTEGKPVESDSKVAKSDSRRAKSDAAVAKNDTKSAKSDNKVAKSDSKLVKSNSLAKSDTKVAKSDSKLARSDTKSASKLAKSDRLAKSATKVAHSDAKLAKSDTKVLKSDNKVAKSDTKLAKSDIKSAKSDSKLAESDSLAKSDTKVAKSDTKLAKGDTKVAHSDTKSDSLAKSDTKVAKSDTKVAKNDTKVAKSDTKAAKSDTKVAKSDTKRAKSDSLAKSDTKVASSDTNKASTSGLSKTAKNTKKTKLFQPPLRKSSHSETSRSEESNNSEPQCHPLVLQEPEQDVNITSSQSPTTSSVAVVPNSEDRLLDILKRLSQDSLPFDMD